VSELERLRAVVAALPRCAGPLRKVPGSWKYEAVPCDAPATHHVDRAWYACDAHVPAGDAARFRLPYADALVALATTPPRPTWTDHCEDEFEWLATHDPRALLALLASGELRASLLTFAAEYAGRTPDKADAARALVLLLGHPAAYVREGVVYGLAQCLTSASACLALRTVAALDPVLEVREAARDALGRAGEDEHDS